jgi:hypothetical protein
MSYEDWDQAQYDLFESMAYDLESDWEFDYASNAYEIGFTIHSDDYEAYGITAADVEASRAEFFEFMDMDPSEFKEFRS